MEHSTNTPSRKKFLLWSAAIVASVTALRFFSRLKRKNTETVKMLTQDGRLVEIDKAALSASRKKISNEELKNWIKK